MQHVDLFTWLRGDILVKADKMTMANSLELRVPFLDPEVFAVASGLPRAAKLGENTTKLALRKALAGIVPPHVLHRRKLGFPVPIRHWLRDEMYDWARGIMRDSQADHLVDLAAVTRMLDAHRDGPDRPQPPHLDAAGVPALARDLRRAADHPGDPRARLPGAGSSALTSEDQCVDAHRR